MHFAAFNLGELGVRLVPDLRFVLAHWPEIQVLLLFLFLEMLFHATLDTIHALEMAEHNGLDTDGVRGRKSDEPSDNSPDQSESSPSFLVSPGACPFDCVSCAWRSKKSKWQRHIHRDSVLTIATEGSKDALNIIFNEGECLGNSSYQTCGLQ